MMFGDGIDWSAEARRAAAADDLKPGGSIGRSDLIDRLAAYLPDGGTVLDAGCNIGRYCPLLQAAGFAYTGVDQSTEALQLAQERNPSPAVFVHSFLWEMEFESQFDAAISFAVLQHNTFDEKNTILPRIAAALRSGSIFLMSESTVPLRTATQLDYSGWISLVEQAGFVLLNTWHPNPEHGLHDAYAFRRL